MALDLDFTITQSADCDTLTFTETTGNSTGGYSDAGNPAYSDVTNTLLKIEFPDATSGVFHKNYLPTQDASPNGTKDYVASDFGYTDHPNGVWEVTFNVYTTDTASGALLDGTEYIVTGLGGQITYDGTVYEENETFIASSTATYTEDVACQVNVLAATKTCNILIYCGVKECLKSLMLQRCGNECDCREDFHNAMNEIIVDFNAAQLAFTALNYDCANKIIKRLEKQCGGICNDCGC